MDELQGLNESMKYVPGIESSVWCKRQAQLLLGPLLCAGQHFRFGETKGK